MLTLSGNKMLSIEFLMLLILLLVIKTINASTLPLSSPALNDLNINNVKNNKCDEITIKNCPELRYNHTTVASADGSGHNRMDISDANEMVSLPYHRGFFVI